MSNPSLSIARRHVERKIDADPEAFDRVVRDALDGCREVMKENVVEPSDVGIEEGENEDEVIVTLPSGDLATVTVSDIEKMLSVKNPYEAWAAILALMPKKIAGEGW